MDTPTPGRLETLAKFGLIAASVVLVLLWPTALLIEKTSAQELVTVKTLFPEAEVEYWRTEFVDEYQPDGQALSADARAGLREEIASIYGVGASDPIQFVFVDSDRVVHAREDPSLALIQKGEDEHLFQLQTVYWLARMATFGSLGAAVFLLGLMVLLRRRRLHTADVQDAAAVPA